MEEFFIFKESWLKSFSESPFRGELTERFMYVLKILMKHRFVLYCSERGERRGAAYCEDKSIAHGSIFVHRFERRSTAS